MYIYIYIYIFTHTYTHIHTHRKKIHKSVAYPRENLFDKKTSRKGLYYQLTNKKHILEGLHTFLLRDEKD